MTDVRRYSEDEVARILRDAATPRAALPGAPGAADGMTLAELQDIGAEVGLSPARIADAAASVDVRRGMPAPRRSLGMPVSVARAVAVDRPPTDHEWDMLVAELRETFHAHGRDRSQGSLRAWSNGNLRAAVEPTDGGWRFRIGTVKGDAQTMNMVGGGALLMALFLLLVTFMRADMDLAGPLVTALMGSATLAFNAVRLPQWAREREAQMEHVAGRARALLSGPAPAPADASSPARLVAGEE